MKSPDDEPLKKIESTLAALAALRPSRVDPAHYSLKAEISAKVASLRAGLLYRIVELATLSVQCVKALHMAAAVVLARSVLETTATLWFATRKIERSLDSKRLDELDDDLMRLLLGFKANKPSPDVPDAVNVFTFFKYVGKEIAGMEGVCVDLSEYAHPNWAGPTSPYARPDLANFGLDFRATPPATAAPAELTRLALEISVVMFQHHRKQIEALMPRLIELTEGSLNQHA